MELGAIQVERRGWLVRSLYMRQYINGAGPVTVAQISRIGLK